MWLSLQKIGYAIFYSKCDKVMSELEDKYISLLTDFGFKRIFGTDLNKDLLIEIAKFNPRELREYEDSRKAYRDLKNCLDTAIQEGLEKGRAEGLEKGRAEGIAEGLEKGRTEGIVEGEKMKSIAIAKKMMAMGLDDDTVMQATGLTASDLTELRTK